MQRVFILSHSHLFPDDSIDWKMIGVFASRERADLALRAARQRPGFRTAQTGFSISEHIVQGVANSPDDAGVSEIFLLFRVGDDPERGEKISVVGAFYSEGSAQEAGLAIQDLADWESIEVYPHDVDKESWLEGYAPGTY